MKDLKQINVKLNKKYIITYEIKKLEPSKRVLFVYLLKGRNSENLKNSKGKLLSKSKGIIQELKGEFLAPGCFIIPESGLKEIKEIFTKWNVKYWEKEVYLMH